MPQIPVFQRRAVPTGEAGLRIADPQSLAAVSGGAIGRGTEAIAAGLGGVSRTLERIDSTRVQYQLRMAQATEDGQANEYAALRYEAEAALKTAVAQVHDPAALRGIFAQAQKDHAAKLAKDTALSDDARRRISEEERKWWAGKALEYSQRADQLQVQQGVVKLDTAADAAIRAGNFKDATNRYNAALASGVLSPGQHSARLADMEKKADYFTATALIDTNPAEAVRQLNAQDKNGNYTELLNLDQSSRQALRGYAREAHNRALSQNYYRILVADPPKSLDGWNKVHAEGLISDQRIAQIRADWARGEKTVVYDHAMVQAIQSMIADIPTNPEKATEAARLIAEFPADPLTAERLRNLWRKAHDPQKPAPEKVRPDGLLKQTISGMDAIFGATTKGLLTGLPDDEGASPEDRAEARAGLTKYMAMGQDLEERKQKIERYREQHPDDDEGFKVYVSEVLKDIVDLDVKLKLKASAARPAPVSAGGESPVSRLPGESIDAWRERRKQAPQLPRGAITPDAVQALADKIRSARRLEQDRKAKEEAERLRIEREAPTREFEEALKGTP